MKIFLFRNLWVRSFLPLSLATIAGILTNTLVTEITKDSKIEWFAIPKTASFYFLLATTILATIYQVYLFRFDKMLLKGITRKQFEAALRNQVLEESAKKVKQLIKADDWEKLEKTTETFKKLFGEKLK